MMPVGLYEGKKSLLVPSGRQRRVVNLQMRKRVRKNEPETVSNLGYSMASRYRADFQEVPIFSGSSLNRKKKYEKESENTGASQGNEEARPKVCRKCGGGRIERRRDILSRQSGYSAKEQSADNDASSYQDLFSGTQRIELRPFCQCKRDPQRRLSVRSRGKIKDKFSAFYDAAGKNCTFCTLTFIANVTDADGAKILNKFLTMLRRKIPGVEYIWVAEHQSRGWKNIHFHIMLNKFIPVQEFNGLWVLQQYRAGLVGWSEKSKTKIDKKQIYSAYRSGTVGNFFNPLDIKKVYGVAGLSSYLTKYVTKNNDSYGCAAWHCSRNVSKLYTKQIISEFEFEQTGTDLNSYTDKETGEYFEPITVATKFAIVRYIRNKKYFSTWMEDLKILNCRIFADDPVLKVEGIPKMTIDEYRIFAHRNNREN